MWLLYSLFSAILTGFVPILGGGASRAIGAEKSAVSRAALVLIGSGILALRSGRNIPIDDPVYWLIFTLAGLLDAAAWLLFYRAIATSTTEAAVIQEKSCVPISILLSSALSISIPSIIEIASIALFTAGIFYSTRMTSSRLPYLSAICSAIQMQLSKIGIDRFGSQENALFIRSAFSLLFLCIFAFKYRNFNDSKPAPSKRFIQTASLLLLSGISAFFAWKFSFSALALTSAAKVQAITKLNFWITGIYLSVRAGGIDKRCWLGYSAMTIGALIMIA